MLRQAATTITVDTRGRGLFEITSDVSVWLADTGVSDGLLTLLLRHTSASLLIHENADSDVRADLDRVFSRLVPDGDRHPWLIERLLVFGPTGRRHSGIRYVSPQQRHAGDDKAILAARHALYTQAR
jgi:hypothetical protein